MKLTLKKEGCFKMLDILLFIFLIVPLVHFIHESGHVFMARIYGVKGTM
ncbi:hypothetical protein [Sutcliffiella sp. FSL R7-0096]